MGHEQPWQYDLLDKLPPSVDETQLSENLRLTPTERLEKMLTVLRFLKSAGQLAPTPDFKERMDLATLRALLQREQ